MKNYVIDTHPLLWYFLSDPQISQKAKETMADILAGDALGYIPTVVLGEAIYVFWSKMRNPQLGEEFLAFLRQYHETLLHLDVFAKDYEELKNYLGKEIMVKKKKKFLEIHDALIVVKTKQLAIPLITKDEVITASRLVDVIW